MTTGQAVLGVSLQNNCVVREVWDPQIIPHRLRNRHGGNCLVLPSSWGLQHRLCCACRWRVQLWWGSRPGTAPGLLLEKGRCQRAGHALVSWIHKLPVTGWGSFPATGKAQVATETISSSYLCWLNALPMLQGPFQLSVPHAAFLRPSWSPSPSWVMACANREDLYPWASLTDLAKYPGASPTSKSALKIPVAPSLTQITSFELLVSWGDDHSLVSIQYNLMHKLTVNFIYPDFWLWPQPHRSCVNKVHRGKRPWANAYDFHSCVRLWNSYSSP